MGCPIIIHKPTIRVDWCRFRDPGGARVLCSCLLDFPRQDAREGMGRMTIRQRRILWFVAIYGLSVGTFALLALLTECY